MLEVVRDTITTQTYREALEKLQFFNQIDPQGIINKHELREATRHVGPALCAVVLSNGDLQSPVLCPNFKAKIGPDTFAVGLELAPQINSATLTIRPSGRSTISCIVTTPINWAGKVDPQFVYSVTPDLNRTKPLIEQPNSANACQKYVQDLQTITTKILQSCPPPTTLSDIWTE